MYLLDTKPFGKQRTAHNLPNNFHCQHCGKQLPREKTSDPEPQQCGQEHTLRQRINQQRQLVSQAVEAVRRRAVQTLLAPLPEGASGIADNGSPFAQHDNRIAACSVLVDKQIVRPIGETIVAYESAAAKEELATVREIAPRARLGVAQQGGAKIGSIVNQVLILLQRAQQRPLGVE